MNYEGPRIHSNIEIQNSNNFLPQHHRMDGSVVNKEDYEEYFMSVNQHKKSLRGEKLIVTKKEESSRSYFKCMGWLFTMILLGGAIAVAVLIGVGVIDTTPRKIKEGRRISTKSELNELDPTKLLEVRDPNAPNVLTNDPNFFNDNNPPKNAVLNVFDGQLRITNMEWDDDLNRKSSEIFQIVSKELEKNLMKLFHDVPAG